MRKLEKWEILCLQLALALPAKQRWLQCPFDRGLGADYYRHCTERCRDWFPKRGYNCPNDCDYPTYTNAQITRKVKSELRKRGVDV